MGGSGSGPPPPPENHKNIGFLSNIGPDPLKIQASIQCWAIIGPPAKRNAISVAFRLRDDDGPQEGRWWLTKWYFDPLSPHQLKRLSELGPL